MAVSDSKIQRPSSNGSVWHPWSTVSIRHVAREVSGAEIVGEWQTYREHQLPTEWQLKRLNWRNTLYRVDLWIGRGQPEGDPEGRPMIFAVDASGSKDAEASVERWAKNKYSHDWKLETKSQAWPIKDGVPVGIQKKEPFDFEAHAGAHGAAEAGPGGALDWQEVGSGDRSRWVAPALGGGSYVINHGGDHGDGRNLWLWYLPVSKDEEAPQLGRFKVLGSAMQAAARHENERAGSGGQRAAEAGSESVPVVHERKAPSVAKDSATLKTHRGYGYEIKYNRNRKKYGYRVHIDAGSKASGEIFYSRKEATDAAKSKIDEWIDGSGASERVKVIHEESRAVAKKSVNAQHHVDAGATSVHVTPDGKVKPVKNLGWLVRNWQSVENFTIVESPYENWDSLMIAKLRDGGLHESLWASREAMKDWLHRPIFRGIKVEWFGRSTVAEECSCAEEYIAVDAVGKVVGGPYKTHSEAAVEAQKHKGYVKFVTEASEDFTSKDAAVEHARQMGARFISGSEPHWFVYIPREPHGFEKRPLFKKAGNFHIGKEKENVKHLPKDAVAIELMTSRAAEGAWSDEPLQVEAIVHRGKPNARGQILWVQQLPGEDGPDWGYTDSSDKAARLSPHWQKRFAKDMRDLGDSAVFVEASGKRSLFDEIRFGSRVTIVDRFGKEHTGRAVMRGPAGWVLNMGGRHGTPGIASPENVTKVSKPKMPRKRKVSEASECAQLVNKGDVAVVERAPGCRPTGVKIDSAADIWSVMHERCAKQGSETFWAIGVNTQGEQIGPPVEIARGQPDRVGVDVEQITAAAIQLTAAGARGVCLIHNHPSFRAKPSAADRRLTNDTRKSMEVACPATVMLDHCIIGSKGDGHGEYFSFTDEEEGKKEGKKNAGLTVM